MSDESEPPAIVCPSCGAMLRNVSVAALKVTCLNCGAKFAPPHSGAGSEASAPVPEADPGREVLTVLGREPAAAGYWLLRGGGGLCGGGVAHAGCDCIWHSVQSGIR